MERKKLDRDEREAWEEERRRGEVAKRGAGGGGGDGGGGRLKWTNGGSRKGGPRGSLSPTFNFRQSEKLVTSLQCLTSRRGPWEEDQPRTSSRALNRRFSRIYSPSSRFPFDLIAAIEPVRTTVSPTVLQKIENRVKIEVFRLKFANLER